MSAIRGASIAYVSRSPAAPAAPDACTLADASIKSSVASRSVPGATVPLTLPDAGTPAIRLPLATVTFASARQRGRSTPRTPSVPSIDAGGTATKRDGSSRCIVASTVNAFVSFKAIRAVPRSDPPGVVA